MRPWRNYIILEMPVGNEVTLGTVFYPFSLGSNLPLPSYTLTLTTNKVRWRSASQIRRQTSSSFRRPEDGNLSRERVREYVGVMLHV